MSMGATLDAYHFLRVQAELGECPVWDHRINRLYLVDIIRCRLIGYDWKSGGVTEWPLPALGGGLALAERGRLVVATQRGIFLFDPGTGSFEPFVNPEPNAHFNRFNEGKCDPMGRFWIGSMSTVDRRPLGKLYAIDASGDVMTALDDIVIPNTLSWTNDNSRMIFADSWRKQVWTFAFDYESGRLGQRRLWINLSDAPGIPDGIANDAEDGFWIAQFGAGRICRYDLDGVPTHEILLPITQITSCTFAGPELDHLVMVSAKRLLSDAQRGEQPTAGDLYVARPFIRGRRSFVFGAEKILAKP